MAVLRGEVVWADLNPVIGSEQGGLRPVLVVQADPVSRHASTTIVLALTSRPQRSGHPLTVALPAGEGGLARASWSRSTNGGPSRCGACGVASVCWLTTG